MFTLNNVFLCLNRLGVKFFQISGSTLQLQQDRNRFTAVGRGAKAGSVWAPFHQVDGKMLAWLRGLCAQEGFVVLSTQGLHHAFLFSHPRGQKLAFLF